MTVVGRHVDVACLQQPRAFRLRYLTHVPDPLLEPMSRHLGIEPRLVRSVADEQKLHPGHLGTDARDSRCQYVDAMPPPERSSESDDAVVVGKAEPGAEPPLLVG